MDSYKYPTCYGLEKKRYEETHDYNFYRPNMNSCAFDGIKKASPYGYDSQYQDEIDSSLRQQTPAMEADSCFSSRTRNEARCMQTNTEWSTMKQRYQPKESCGPDHDILQSNYTVLDNPPISSRSARIDDRLDVCFNPMHCNNQVDIVSKGEVLRTPIESRKLTRALFEKIKNY